MKLRILLGIGAVLQASLASGLSQSIPPPPANDNFTNRTILTGTDVVFDGTLAGATFEWVWSDAFQMTVPEVQGYPIAVAGGGTVWWSWTATETSTAILQVVRCSTNSFRTDVVAVYTVTNNDSGDAIAGLKIDTAMPWRYFTFPVVAGTAYQIQLIGPDSASYTMRLVATDLPWIIEQPKSQAITVGDSVLFGVVVAGLKPFSYQWQLDGTDLPGETAPMLALDHVGCDQAGTYQVLITNPSGTTTSSIAQLWVTGGDPASQLTAAAPLSSQEFAFQTLSDPGRRYRVESATNLIDWSPEASFLLSVFYNSNFNRTLPTSVIVNSTGSDIFRLPITGSRKFVRTTSFHAVNEVCNNNIKRLRLAQVLFACDRQLGHTDSVSVMNLLPYLKDGYSIHCPSASTTNLVGSYGISMPLQNPWCVFGHAFEEP